MKKLLATLLLAVTSLASATETITIIWPFNIGSNQANTVRAIIAEANAKQKDYEFVLENKPGAGGAIAAKYVLERPANTILAMSSSFFIRPNFDREVGASSYDVTSFKPVLIQAVGSPIAVLSKRYATMQDLVMAKDVTVGIAGIGTISHLVANTIIDYTTVRLIPYPSMVAADKDVMGRHIDASTDFVGDITSYIGTDYLNVLGVTGTKPVGDIKTLEQLGYKGFTDLVANYGMYASSEMPEATARKIYEILNSVNRNESVVNSYKKDILTPVNYSPAQSTKWFNEQAKYWKFQSERSRR